MKQDDNLFSGVLHGRRLLLCAVLLFSVRISPCLSAAEENKPESAPEKKPEQVAGHDSRTAPLHKLVGGISRKRVYKDKLNRDTPRSSMQAFLEAARGGNFAKAAKYLNFHFLDEKFTEPQKEDYARKLRIVLDRAIWIDMSRLSDSPAGHDEEDLDGSQEKIAALDLSDGSSADILMQRVYSDSGMLIWMVAPSTVRRIPKLYQEYGYGELGEFLANYLPSYTFLSLELWQWCVLIIILFIVFLAVYIPTKIAAVLLGRSRLRFGKDYAAICSFSLRFLLFLLVSRGCVYLLRPPAALRAIMQAQTLLLAAVVWLVCDFLGLLRNYLQERLKNDGRPTVAVLLQPLTNIVRFIVIVITAMVWFENMGFQATTVLTGFGLGGLAVALAAQKSIENIIGAVTLHASAPVKLGDFGKFGDVMGTIEFIGLRYTKIRTLEQTLVSVPNATFVDMQLESFTERKKIRYKPVIKITRAAMPEQIRSVLAGIGNALGKHPMVEPESFRVRFQEFGEYSLNIHIVAYMKTTVYSEYLEAAEDLNLKIMDVLHDAGVKLAVPERIISTENNESKK